MIMFNMTQEELEDFADSVKVVVLEALVADGLIGQAADQWAEKTTILYRKKSFFRTLTDKWLKQKTETSQYHCIVVSKR